MVNKNVEIYLGRKKVFKEQFTVKIDTSKGHIYPYVVFYSFVLTIILTIFTEMSKVTMYMSFITGFIFSMSIFYSILRYTKSKDTLDMIYYTQKNDIYLTAIEQIQNFESNSDSMTKETREFINTIKAVDTFFTLYSAKHLYYGSGKVADMISSYLSNFEVNGKVSCNNPLIFKPFQDNIDKMLEINRMMKILDAQHLDVEVFKFYISDEEYTDKINSLSKTLKLSMDKVLLEIDSNKNTNNEDRIKIKSLMELYKKI